MEIKSNLHKYNQQTGLSLIEGVVCLVIAAIVVSGVLIYFNYTQDQHRIDLAVDEFASAATGLQKIYSAGTSDYRGAAQALSLGHELPPFATPRYDKDFGDWVFKNPWNGDFRVKQEGEYISFQMLSLPKSACILVATYNYGSEVKQIRINGDVVPVVDGKISLNITNDLCKPDVGNEVNLNELDWLISL